MYSYTVTRVNSSNIQQYTDIDFSATSLNPIPSASIAKFRLSLKQFDINNTMTQVHIYKMASGVKGAEIPYTFTQTTDYIEFTLTSWCTAPCPEATKNFDFRIEGFKNYPTTKPPTVPNSFTVVNFEGKKIE